MSSIQLQNVTKVYRAQPSLDPSFVPAGPASKADRAFSERVLAHDSLVPDTRRKVTALDDVTLTIDDGSTLAVIGPTGCGKTTLLRVIAGLEDNFSGQVFYDDRDMTAVPVHERHIGMVFQNYALYPHFEGRGNLAFSFLVRRAPDEETEERIKETSDVMGIGFRELLGRKPGKLSGGQQQRLAIARAIVRQPDLFLFDEPLSNLDAKLRERTRGEIKRLLHRFEITSIYVTHDQLEAISLGDKIAVMRAGKVEQVGKYHELRANPATAFVAGFFGTPPMNLFEDVVVSEGAVKLGEILVPLPDEILSAGQGIEKLVVGFRPEVATIGWPGEDVAGSLAMPGEVEVIEPDFGQRKKLVHARTAQGLVGVVVPLESSVAVGDAVSVVFSSDQLYYFQGEDGLLTKAPNV